MEGTSLSPSARTTAFAHGPSTHFQDDASRDGTCPRPLQVVILDEELPYPPNSGKRIRTLNLTLRLAQRHRITYLCHRNADAEEARRAAEFFGDHGIETVVVDRAVPPRSGPWFYTRLAANLLSPLPYTVASHNSRALRRAIRQHAATRQVDLWHCEWTPYYAAALRAVPGGPRLVMAHNVESLIWQRYYETESNRLKRWYIGRQWRKFVRFERCAYATATRTVAVSAEDAALIRDRFGAQRVTVVENGVDTSSFRPGEGPRQPGQVLFVGSLDWRPNLDAVTLLLEQVFPAVRACEPSARLCVVGRNPPMWLRQRAADTGGAELHADVADVRPFLHRSAVLAVPLRIGGGSRLKILEALACGLPVVSTRVGAEGLCLESGRHLTVTDDVESMAGALLHCFRAPGEALAQAVAGRCVVLQRYNWDALADKLERVWVECAASEKHRQVNSLPATP
jgi:glycosyltransferase involved in cell wall biosynthesis